MLDRRTFLAASTALGALVATGCVTEAERASAGRDEQLDALLTRWFEEDLRDSPTLATNLGLDVGELAFLRGELAPQSLARAEEERAQAVARIGELRRFGRAGL